MSPSEEVIKDVLENTLNKTIKINIGNLIKDFNIYFSSSKGITQQHCDLLFIGFIAGVLNPINPDTNFNSNYLYTKEK